MRQQKNPPAIAYFITSHGFGHAARSAAIMAAIREIIPDIHFHIFSQTPQWIFEETIVTGFTYHFVKTDIGLVQATPMSEDISKTLSELEEFLTFKGQEVSPLVLLVRNTACRIVLCDISPLGIVVAHKAGIPSVLIENFTWDWIYENYLDKQPGFFDKITLLRSIYDSVDIHIQTRPACQPAENVSLVSSPVSRKIHSNRLAIRSQLKISSKNKVVLITMGGIPDRFNFYEALFKFAQYTFVIPGGSDTYSHQNNLVLFPHHSNFYNPDLVAASDIIMGKAGYSTVAEVYHAGLPFGFITRPSFRESPSLAQFTREEMNGIEIPLSDFQSANWEEYLERLSKIPKRIPKTNNGANEIAGFITHLL